MAEQRSHNLSFDSQGFFMIYFRISKNFFAEKNSKYAEKILTDKGTKVTLLSPIEIALSM